MLPTKPTRPRNQKVKGRYNTRLIRRILIKFRLRSSVENKFVEVFHIFEAQISLVGRVKTKAFIMFFFAACWFLKTTFYSTKKTSFEKKLRKNSLEKNFNPEKTS